MILKSPSVRRETVLGPVQGALLPSVADEPSGAFNRIICGDACEILKGLGDATVDLSFFSPPYFVGKSYESDWSFDDWKNLLREVTAHHARILKPSGFMAVNIGDILCFPDHDMPRFQANNVGRKTSPVTRDEVLAAQMANPDAGRRKLAGLLGCSEQTVQRWLEHNNIRGGKHGVATKVKLTGAKLVEWAEAEGLYLYDQRIWHKNPAWLNSHWHSNSYRAVDEFEHLYVFWRPGIVEYDRSRLTTAEWTRWGSRGVWRIPSVRSHTRHEAEFPEELATRVIRLFSPEAGVVIDPFVGSGTTTSVAKRLNRYWLGIDSNAEYAALATERTNLA